MAFPAESIQYAVFTRRIATLAAFCAVVPSCMAAQTCVPPSSSHEADLFAIRSMSFAMGRGAAIAADAPGTIRAGVEAVWLPHIDDETARPTACRAGKGPENVNTLPALARARVSVALPEHLTVDLSWIPPVRLKEMEGNVFGVALGYAQRASGAVTVGLRAHATTGHVTGPFTCPQKEIENPESECFEGTRSADRLEPNVVGGDVTVNWAPAGHRFSWYAGGGYSRLLPRFGVHFLNSAGVLDTTRVTVDLNRVAFFGGVTAAVGTKWRASGEVYATAGDGATARLAFDRVLRHGH